MYEYLLLASHQEFEYSTNPQDDHVYIYGSFASIVVCLVPARSSDLESLILRILYL